MSLISEAGGLYVGGLDALDNPDLLEENRVTHILTVLEFDYCDYEEFDCYEKMLITAEDDPREDLLQHFSDTNLFIQDALADDGAVLVHCAMGHSRSVTIACAYLMWAHRLSAKTALSLLQSYHAEAQPNEGFMRQLEAYGRILSDDEPTDDEGDGVAYSDVFDRRREKMTGSGWEGIVL